jgi:hypothetical protein
MDVKAQTYIFLEGEGGSATIGNVPVIKWTAVFGVFISRFFYFAIFEEKKDPPKEKLYEYRKIFFNRNMLLKCRKARWDSTLVLETSQ